jgi:hypothetical protein
MVNVGFPPFFWGLFGRELNFRAFLGVVPCPKKRAKPE